MTATPNFLLLIKKKKEKEEQRKQNRQNTTNKQNDEHSKKTKSFCTIKSRKNEIVQPHWLDYENSVTWLKISRDNMSLQADAKRPDFKKTK